MERLPNENDFEKVEVPQGIWLNIGDETFQTNFGSIFDREPSEELLDQLASLMGIVSHQDYIVFTLAEAKLIAKALVMGSSQADLLLDCEQTILKADVKLKDQAKTITKLEAESALLTEVCWLVGGVALVAILFDVYFLWRDRG